MVEASTIRKGGLLKKIRARDNAAENDQQQQLLQLFEKRNELKREFAQTLDHLEKLRTEHAGLSARHEREHARLAGLEEMLADPQRGQNAIIYYRLDSLWKTCRSELERRRQELVDKFEQLERQKLLEKFKAQAAEQQRQLEAKFSEVDSLYQEMADNLKLLHEQLRECRRPWHYFRKKKLIREIQVAEEQVAPVVAQRDECLAELERVRDREPPRYKGLSVAAMREINLQLLALAQYLYIQFSENDFSQMARATQEKAPAESHYGTPQECLAMERPLREALLKLQKDDKRADRLKRRADFLRQNIQFTGNTDTVPESQGLSRIALSLGTTSQSLDSMRGDIGVNVLEQGYWGVDELLLRQ